ncbi:hypothetical protein CGLO_01997 [Colletotrichum gloeosporioides Cg-14]|uniref:Uncharacterized protein n=1 Tax=Colletotrichum gloeosporioides (strain Cg-14) TaxID=1237896 RepID=T0M241_COLGC|nr:hypothetical protein CGLO_01997 [Colletotrichum gloeosporioides Cg-14]
MTANAPLKSALETVPHAGGPNSKAHTEPDHSNSYNTEQELTSSTGGLSIEDKIEGELLRHDRQKRVKILVGLFLKTCPGDWDSGTDVALCSQLMSVVDGRQLEMRFDAIAVVCYRWQLAHLADVLVRVFGLPKPNGESCLMWRYHDWRARAGKVFQYFDQRYSAVWGQLVNSSFEPRPLRDQGPPFYRFQRYVTAAVVEADLGPDATRALVNKLIEYMVVAKKTLQEQVIQDKEIRHRGRNWIKSVDRAVRRSLSPRKSISGQSYRDRSDTATSRHSRGGSSSSVMDNKPILTSPRASAESQRPSFDIVRRLSERKGKGSNK